MGSYGGEKREGATEYCTHCCTDWLISDSIVRRSGAAKDTHRAVLGLYCRVRIWQFMTRACHTSGLIANLRPTLRLSESLREQSKAWLRNLSTVREATMVCGSKSSHVPLGYPRNNSLNPRDWRLNGERHVRDVTSVTTIGPAHGGPKMQLDR